jgi:hypothetical protein
MDVRDYTRLAQALAKASLQPGISAASVEHCIYQIGLVLARGARRFDLEAWQREIGDWRVALLDSAADAELCSDPSVHESACGGSRSVTP